MKQAAGDVQLALLEMLRFPYRRFAIDSELPRDAAMARIEGIVEPRSPLVAAFVRTNKLFAGEVSGNRFKIMRIISYGNSMLPVIEGVFEPLPSGSCVAITMRLTRFVSVFSYFWFGGLTIGLLVAFLVAATSTTHPAWMIPLGMLAFGYGLFSIAFNIEADKAQTLLQEALQVTPSARVDQALTETSRPRFSRFVKLVLATTALGAGIAALTSFLSPIYLRGSEPFRVAVQFLDTESTIRAELGDVTSVEPVRWQSFHVAYAGPDGDASFTVNVTGRRRSGRVILDMERHDRIWTVHSAQLRDADGRTIALAAPSPD